MRRSIATVSVSGTLAEKLDAIAAARFDGVEIFENDLLFFTGTARDVRRYAGDVGLAIDLFQPFRDFEGVSDEQLRRNLDRAERKFDVMEELGAPLMLACSNASAEVIDDDELAAAQLTELATRAAARGLKVGYEALSWGTRVNTFEHAWRILEKANHPHLGLIVDSFHTLALPDDWSGLSKLPGERIFFVQLADAPRLGMQALPLSRHFRCFPGQGDFAVQDFLQSVLATGYTGTISLEIFNDDMRAAPPRRTAEDGMRSLLFLEEQVRRSAETEAAASSSPTSRPARRRVDLFDPPSPPVLSGVAFIEFATDPRSEGALASMLGEIGFRVAGQHRRKDVALLAQGDIRLVLNKEPDSFAHSYALIHGPSVCALALGTDDAFAALGRAEAYGCRRFQGRIGPGEHAIPGVHSPEGGLIYFTELGAGNGAGFETDFAVADGSDVQGAGLLRVDHVAQALPEGQLDSWVLFYRAVLGLEPEDSIDIPDPYGLIRSKAVSNRERTVRFPLNISESRNTATARSVSTFAGAGVNHIAFATADIFAAAEAMRSNGARILPIPANYYDDIAARFQLPEGELDRMRELNILYDRAADGEFRHFYTLPFEDRFFFEIVQRTGAYTLYGAANAPVRLAALAQVRGPSLAQILR
jgi:4-hydroxyphenylpyruvate dioxygenase